MNLLEKIRGLSETKRKIILWTGMIALAVFLFSWYVKSAKQILSSLDKEGIQKGLNLPNLGEELDKLPETQTPQQPEPPASSTEAATDTVVEMPPDLPDVPEEDPGTLLQEEVISPEIEQQ